MLWAPLKSLPEPGWPGGVLLEASVDGLLVSPG